MDTGERLEKLERELFAEKRRNRWLPAAALVGLVGVGLALTLATITATVQRANIGPKMIRANHFILEDETGNVRAMLRADKDGTRLSLVDENDKTRARLEVSRDGPMLALFDENDKIRARLVVIKGVPMLVLADETRNPRVVLRADKAGAALRLLDENGKGRAGLFVYENGPGLSLVDKSDKLRVALDVVNGPRLGLLDANGKTIWSKP